MFLFINIILDCLRLCLFHAFINKDHVFLWQCCFYSFKTFFLASNFSLYFLVCLFISKYLPSIMFQKTCFSTKLYNWISIELSLKTLFFLHIFSANSWDNKKILNRLLQLYQGTVQKPGDISAVRFFIFFSSCVFKK